MKATDDPEYKPYRPVRKSRKDFMPSETETITSHFSDIIEDPQKLVMKKEVLKRCESTVDLKKLLVKSDRTYEDVLSKIRTLKKSYNKTYLK